MFLQLFHEQIDSGLKRHEIRFIALTNLVLRSKYLLSIQK